jgi:hypothetical protein
MIGVPFARPINPISKTNWEGTAQNSPRNNVSDREQPASSSPASKPLHAARAQIASISFRFALRLAKKLRLT